MTAPLQVEVHEGLLGETAMAAFSPDRVHRYALTRTWNPELPVAAFIMLNPSTADAFADDPTIRHCLGFARTWHCGGLLVLNLFALRATDPAALRDHPDPVGPCNDLVVAEQFSLGGPSIGPVVAAWGAHGTLLDRGQRMTDLLYASTGQLPSCLGLTRDGHPRHPLYLPADMLLVPFGARR